MPIEKIELERFSAFKKLEESFSPGLNVFIGENATGKSHLMKVMYSLAKPLEALRQLEHPRIWRLRIEEKLARIFRPEDNQIGRLVHRTVGRSSAKVRLEYGRGQSVSFSLSTLGNLKLRMGMSATPPCVFIPTCEALSIYEGFVAAYENRELAFDETYYDLCKALSATRLRGARMDKARSLLRPLEDSVGGRVFLRGGRFHVQLRKRAGNIEAHLLAEGHRKIASIVHLIANGTLMKNAILFWDEPEVNLNPKLITIVAQVLRSLVDAGVQIFVATHSYLLSQELSLAAEYQTKPVIDTRFFAFSRPDASSPVTVESGDSLAELQENPILQEFADHYDREQGLFYGATKRTGAAR